MATSTEIKKALTKQFKGVKFSVTTDRVLYETITVKWTGGPFIDEVKAITDAWNTFEDHSDSMTDYFSYRGTKIEFSRSFTKEELQFLAIAIPKIHYSNINGYDVVFDEEYECFKILGIGWYESHRLTHELNESLSQWTKDGLAISLEKSPQAIEAARQAQEKARQEAMETLEANRDELIKGDYQGTPANENLDHIIIHWHEGFQVIEGDAKFSSFKSAHEAIIKTCQVNEDINVGKLKFSVIFRDGEVYEGRLYLSPGEDNCFTTDNIIGKHCVEFLEWQIKNNDDTEADEYLKEYLKKYSFEDTPTPAIKSEKTDNEAIASEWVLNPEQAHHLVKLAEDDKVSPPKLQQMLVEQANKAIETNKQQSDKANTAMVKYTQWVSQKVANGQHSKIIAFDDWLEIYTVA